MRVPILTHHIIKVKSRPLSLMVTYVVTGWIHYVLLKRCRALGIFEGVLTKCQLIVQTDLK